MGLDREKMHLHPILRERIAEVEQRLAEEELPFAMFEGFRSPQRQANLFAQGRTRPGPRVTKANAWSSYHQYGVAADFVLRIDGRWSWDDAGARARHWQRLHELAGEVGLRPLSWEKPHLQLEGVALSALRDGVYPPGGDETWAENLADAIESWLGEPPAPPVPDILPQRPALATEQDEAGEVSASAPNQRLSKRVRVTARSGLRVRAGPGPSFDVTRVLPLHSEVFVLNVAGDWCLIDQGGDGLADGYCFGGYLEQVA